MAHIVITGTPVDGFTHYGPFPDLDAASEFSEGEACHNIEWWIVELTAPEGEG